MKPKIYFVLRTLFFALSAVLGFLFVLYLISFVFFCAREARGFFPLLFGLPWFLIFLSVVLVVLLEILVRHFSFGYRAPILYTLLGIILFVILGGFFINKTPMHQVLFDRAEKNRLPIMGPMYRGYGKQFDPMSPEKNIPRFLRPQEKKEMRDKMK